MEKKEMVRIAIKAIEKKLDFEELKYSDYLYDHEGDIDAVWEYVEECERIGTIAFFEKYKDFIKK